MANTYFKFKQFTVNQHKSAMKVCTDSCLFGAYISSKEKNFTDERNILDIGTGTGLLALMIAQKVKGNIDAVEIDEDAYEQAQQNFRNSAWNKRLSVSHANITQFEFDKKYHIIVSNPPFFVNALKSSDNSKNIAKHTTTLPYTELVTSVFTNLISEGKFYILLPCKEFEAFEKIAKNQLSVVEKLFIKQNKESNFFRTIGVFSNTMIKELTEDYLTIKEDNEAYSQKFISLLKDYYLYL